MLIALLFLSAVTLYADSPSIRCSYEWDQPEANTAETNWEINPIDEKTFQSVFHGARQSLFGSDSFSMSRKDGEGEDGEPTTILTIGIATNDHNFFRLEETFDSYDERLEGLPEIVRVANSPSGPLFLLTIESTIIGANTRTPISRKLILTLHPKPRVAAFVECFESGGGGACTAFDAAYSSHTALECDWSRKIDDYVCATTRAYPDFHWMTHAAERRFTLIGDKSLPVAKHGMKSFRNLQELATALKTNDDLADERVIVQGVGVLAPIDRQHRRWLYAAPGVGDDMELRLFAFAQAGAPLQVALHKIVDGHEAEETKSKPEPEFTPIADEWTVSTGYSFAMGRLEIVPIVLHDGKGRGLFWLGVDTSMTPATMSLLRIASDVGPYDHCRTFIYPASASIATVANDHADLTIEPHSRRDDEGDAVTWDEGDPMPCHVHGTLTWNRDKGFFLMLTDVPCKPDEARAAVVIDAFGHLSSTPLHYVKK
ncbi:MAG TPA: hypothetical protein VGQ21_13120 [Thermoanaerobaculia bacterium]|nr:hypothetical protein [Thermoanaerobaculia bacterium]